MFNYTCLNPIAGVGLDLFSDDYKKVDYLAGADAALVRSAAMHDLDLPDSLLAVARAGVGSAATMVVMMVPILIFILAESNILETMASSGIKD